MNVDLILKDIEDVYSRENFRRLLSFFNLTDLLNGEFKFFEVEISQANTIFALPHGLKFIPQDIIFVSVDGDHNFYFRYQEFDKTNMYIFVQGPCKLRFFAGAYKDPSYGRKVSDLTLIPPEGASGAATTWFTGSGAPLGTIGVIGDFYLDLSAAAKNVYLKTGALTWTLEGNVLTNHPASTVSLAIATTDNTIVGSSVQDYINRFNEPSESQAFTYNGDGTVNFLECFSSATQITANRIFRTDFTYNVDLTPATETLKIYSKTNGTTVLKTVTKTYTWVASQLTTVTQVTS